MPVGFSDSDKARFALLGEIVGMIARLDNVMHDVGVVFITAASDSVAARLKLISNSLKQRQLRTDKAVMPLRAQPAKKLFCIRGKPLRPGVMHLSKDLVQIL